MPLYGQETQPESSPMRVRVWRDASNLGWLLWFSWRVFVSRSSSAYH